MNANSQYKHRWIAVLFAVAWMPCAAADSAAVFEGKTIEQWAQLERSDFASFRDGVERWGLDGVPHWVGLLAADRSAVEKTAALRAIEMTLRYNGVEKFKRAAEQVAVPAMLPLLRDNASFMRSRALNALRALGPSAKAAIPELLAILRDKNDPDAARFSTRTMAALALGEIHEQADVVVPALCEAMGDRDPQLRRMAVSALGSMAWRAKTAIPKIEAAASLEDAEFRRIADQALEKIRRPAPPMAGDPLPEFELVKVGASGVRSAKDFSGSVVVLEFWSATCAPCQTPMTKLEGLAKTREDWRGKVALVGISVDPTADVAAKHAAARGWKTMEILFDEGGRIHERLRASLPETILIDQTGKIVWRGHPTDLAVEEEIVRLLQTPKAE